MTRIYAVFGASGFGREVMPLARQQLLRQKKSIDQLVFIDDDPPSKMMNGHKVMTLSEFMDVNVDERYVTVAIADSSIREKLEIKLTDYDINRWSVVASNIVMMDKVNINEGAILCPFVTLTSNIEIGKSFHANLYSYVAHDCVIGDYVTFAPSVKCNGNVIIENHAYIGAGAVIKQGKSSRPLIIGEKAIIGLGAVVTKSVKPGTTVIGNPAKVLSTKNLRQ